MEDKKLLQAHEPILYFSGKPDNEERDYTERFYPMAIEDYLGGCELWKSPSWTGWVRWFRSPRKVRQWDKDLEEKPADEVGPHRAQFLGEKSIDQNHFLKFIPDNPKKIFVWPDKKERKNLLSLSGCSLVIILAFLMVVWWAWSNQVIWLAWLGGIPAGFFTLGWVALVLFHFFRDDHQIPTTIIAFFSTIVLGWVSYWAKGAEILWLAWLTGALALFWMIAFWGGVLTFLNTYLSPEQAETLQFVLVLILMAVGPIIALGVWGPGWSLLPCLASLVFTIALFIGSKLIAALMELTSPLRNQSSDLAYKKVQEIYAHKEHPPYTYHGRVWRDPSGSEIVLQYFLFYPFNDWRRQNGFNFHEGDWEAVFVFLNQAGAITGVGLSQHNLGDYRDVSAADLTLKDGHPVVYVAAGSHANYFSPTEKMISQFFKPSLIQRGLALIEKIRSAFFLAGPEDVGSREAKERPNGLGMVIGPAVLDQTPPHQKRVPWQKNPCVLSDEALPGWTQYRGLWGRSTANPEESGPTGPQWDRPWYVPKDYEKELHLEGRRLYWVYPLQWRARVIQEIKNQEQGK